MLNRRTAAAALLTMGLCSNSLAQETTGSIEGKVVSPDGLALPGVMITVEDADRGIKRTTHTDGRGAYSVIALAPSTYNVTAALAGFQTAQRGGVRVALGAGSNTSFVMSIGKLSETVSVTAEAPVIDKTSTVSGLTLNTTEVAKQLPITREATNIAVLAPATTEGDTAFDGRAPGQNLISIGGASVAENSYQVNGLNITNFRNGLGSSNVPFEFVEEVQVKTGGYEAEFGRSTGGVINMVTKRGTNAFHGSVNLYSEPSGLYENSPDTYVAYNHLEERSITESNLSIGGPLLKDKVFFYAFAQLRNRDITTATLSRATLSESNDPLFGGRLDVNLTPNHRLEGTFFTDRADYELTTWGITDDGSPRIDRGNKIGTGLSERGGKNFVVKYSGILSPSLVLSAQYGRNEYNRTDSSTADESPWAYDSRDGGLTAIGNWVNTTRGSAQDDRDAYRIDLDYLVSSHKFRAGMDYEKNVAFDQTEYSGGVYYRYFTTGGAGSSFPSLAAGTEIVRVRVFEGGGEFDTINGAFYVQDSWEVSDRLNLNLGLRLEQYNNKNAEGKSFIKVDNQLAPRLGATYDVLGDGNSKLYGSYGRYHLPIAANTNIRLAGGEFFTEDFHAFSGGINSDGSPGSLGANLESNVFSDGSVPDTRTVLQKDIEPMYQEEYSLGYDQSLNDEWSVGVRGVYRQFGNVIEDITIDRALLEKYGIEDHGVYVLANPGTDFKGFYDLDGDGEPDEVSFTASELGYPEAERKYRALEFTLHKQFVNSWMMQASYTLSQSEGNYEGYVRSDNGQDDAGITTLFDYSGLLDNGYGDLPNDRRHNVKLFGAYQFGMGLQAGGVLKYATGRPINAFGIHPTDEFAADYGAESFFADGVAAPRGSRGRTDAVTAVDLSLSYGRQIGDIGMTLRVDAINVFDSDTVTQVNETFDQETGDDDPNYKSPTQFQSPRRVRFGVGFTF